MKIQNGTQRVEKKPKKHLEGEKTTGKIEEIENNRYKSKNFFNNSRIMKHN